MSCHALSTATHAAKPGMPRIQRKCSGAKATAQTNEAPCAQCQAEAVHAVGAVPTPPSAPKGSFEVGAHDDAYEREADRLAHQVMNGKPASPASSTPPRLQRLLAATPNVTQAPTGVQQALATPGMPMDRRTRAFFEPRFGRDFSSVRLHADDVADRSARSLDAQAYTVGHHVVFSRGKYSPGAESGKRLLAHELAHVVQQSHSPGTVPPLQRKKGKGKGPGSCGYFSALADTTLGGAAHVQIQKKLLTRGIQAELEIPRATKLKGLTRGCQKLGTPAGFADLARVTGPLISFAEIKPYYIAKTLGRLEVRHYRRRAEQSQQRITRLGTCGLRSGPGPDDWGFFYRVGAIGPATSFGLLSGVINGNENFGAFRLDPKLDLIAADVGSGGVGYWCRQNAAGKKAAEEEKKKKKKPRGKGGGANLGIGVSIGGSSAGVGNVGVSVSIDSNSASVGTAGASIAISSDSATAGAAGASATKDSMSASGAVAGASSAKDTDSVTAGAAGASKSSGSMSASAGVAGKSKSQDDIAASAGQAGKSESKDSLAASAGGSGSNKSEGVTGAGKGGTPKKPVDPNDVSGSQAEKTPDAKGDAEAAQGAEGTRGGGEGGKAAGEGESTSGAGGDKEAGGTSQGSGDKGSSSKGGQGGGTGDKGPGQGRGDKSQPSGSGQKGAGDKGTGSAGTGGKDQQGQGQGPGGAQNKPVPGQGPGSGKGTGAASNPLGVYTVIPLGTSDAERERIAEEAAKVAVLVQKASEAQKDLLRHLSSTSPDKRYLVPTSMWVQKMMDVTKGLSADDIQYLKQLNWTPGRISEAELRKRIEKILANKPKTPPKGQGGSMKAPDVTGGQGGGKGTGQGTGQDQGSTGKKAGTGTDTGPKTPKDKGIGVDRATAPPKGSDRTTAGDFTYVILSGISHTSQLKPGQAVSCRVRIHDLRTEQTFDLDGVSITFASRTDTPVTIKGVKFANIKFKLYFTNDFWSEKNMFYGKGGEDTAAEYDFGRRKVK